MYNYCAGYNMFILVYVQSWQYGDFITWHSPRFSRVLCGCDKLTRVSSLANQNPWGSRSASAWSSRFIRIRFHSVMLDISQHSLETCKMLNLRKVIIEWKPIRGLLSTISPNMNWWRTSIGRDFSSCRLELTWATMEWLHLVHLNGHGWASQLMI